MINLRIAQMRTDEELLSPGCGSGNTVEDRGRYFPFSTAPSFSIFQHCGLSFLPAPGGN